MEKYLGVKLIKAEPAIKKGGKVYLLSWPIPKTMEPVEEGYKVVYEDGYESWSPKDVFEKAYRKISGLSCGLAIEAAKKGFKIARTGWNGKGMFVYYIPGGDYTTQTEVAKKSFGETAHYNPYLAIKTVSGAVSTWVPSINDVLADDWQIVGE